MTVTDILQKYPEIELFGRESSYQLGQLILKADAEKSPLAYLLGLGIPLSSALTLATKMASDACRIIDTLIQSIQQGEYAGGNVQTLVVDFVEYLRSTLGILGGALLSLFSPRKAAECFLTMAASPAQTFLTADEGAHLYAMADRLHAFFIKHNIDYRICSGTALGAIREQGIIRNDDDLDLMIHPDSIEQFKRLLEEGTFARETGICIEKQPVTGGWQCFYSDSPKGQPGTPTERIGKPFIDIFPGTLRRVNGEEIITYGEDKMYLQSKGDHFKTKEWGTPTLYNFGPTQLQGIAPQDMKTYLQRCYGPSALNYRTLLYPHEVYSTIYANPLQVYSLWSHPAPRYLRHKAPSALDFSHTRYNEQRALSSLPDNETRSWVDGIFDVFHVGHQNILRNAIEFTLNKHKDQKMVLLIGVCGDGEDVVSYKRKPIMSLEERCRAIDVFMQDLVKKYPNVTYQIVPDSPVTHTLEFIQKHRLNTLFHGSDFTEDKIKQYYGVILEQCIGTCSFEILPYTPGVSTSELIKHLQDEGDLGTTPNTSLVSMEELVSRVRARFEPQLAFGMN